MDYHSGVKSNKSNISLHFSQVNSYKEVSLSLSGSEKSQNASWNISFAFVYNKRIMSFVRSKFKLAFCKRAQIPWKKVYTVRCSLVNSVGQV